MARIVEKIVAGKDASSSLADLSEASLADTKVGSKEFFEAREERARKEFEMNLTTNALISHQPGETIGVRVVESDDKSADGKTISVEEAIGDAEAAKATEKKPTSTSSGGAKTSPQVGSSIAGSGTGNTRSSE